MMKKSFLIILAFLWMTSTAGAVGVSSGGSVSNATEAVSGISERCTDAEMTAGVKVDCDVTPANAKVELDKKAAINASTTGSAGSLKSPATTGLLTATGMGAGETRVMNVPNEDFTVAYVTLPVTADHSAGFDGTTGKIKDLGMKITYTEPASNVPICRTGAATTGACTNIVIEKIAVFNFPGDAVDGTAIDSYIPQAVTITGWVMTTNGAACSAVVDIWAQAYADFPPEDAQSIAGTELPTLTTAQMGKDVSLTTWTTSVAADSFLRANLDSSDCAGTITVTILGTK